MSACSRALQNLSAGGLALLSLALVSGCGTLPSGRGWGQDAVYPIQWKRVAQAAKHALLDPVTLVSIGGAAVFTIDDFDEDVSRWAGDHTPVFGSPEDADDTSDLLMDVLRGEAFATSFLTPSGDDPLGWSYAKAKGLGVEYLATLSTSQTTDLIKGSTDRLRPDGSNRRSLPSGHASSAFASARLANRHFDAMDLPPWARTTVKSGNLVMASATAWARVEAGKHYPSDVLVGAALGNFVTSFIYDAFLNLPDDSRFSFYLEPSPSGVLGAVGWDF